MIRPLWSLVDIGINLTDGMYKGLYNGHETPLHPADLDAVARRALDVGVNGLLITGGSVDESAEAAALATSIRSTCPGMRAFSTVGCHPTRCSAFLSEPDEYLDRLRQLLQQHSVALHGPDAGGVVAAIGEIGLDYDRLHFCPKEVQIPYFIKQLELASEFKLPLFLHDRNTGGDFHRIIKEHRALFSGGVVHSFTGTLEEMKSYLDLGLMIGINGCSLKTEENLAVVKQIPIDRILIETDGPWCEIKNTHASRKVLTRLGAKSVSQSLLKPIVGSALKKEKFVHGAAVKGRNEPCFLVEVLETLFVLLLEDPRSAGHPAMQSLDSFAAQLATNTTSLLTVL